MKIIIGMYLGLYADEKIKTGYNKRVVSIEMFLISRSSLVILISISPSSYNIQLEADQNKA